LFIYTFGIAQRCSQKLAAAMVFGFTLETIRISAVICSLQSQLP
jgi:hypothetical protein